MANALRIRLLQNPSFDIIEAFRIFDIDQCGYVSRSRVEDTFLNELGIILSRNEIELFMRRYDQDSDGLIRFSDFYEVLISKNEDAKINNMIK